jgi:hypothetical protein
MAWIEEDGVVGVPMIGIDANCDGELIVGGFEIAFTGRNGAVVEKTVSNICKFVELVSSKNGMKNCTIMLSCVFEDESPITEETYKKVAHCLTAQHEARERLREMCKVDTKG